ncbi:tetratricopeptide repeat protein [Spirochaeta cellobiosiphila]|uniref:tetratricopeptide repeat protein n=1 Tax=Spirochaeta cellobiosiphila TaxID=504483 RepID=UPI0004132508|nr:tetratricopeptide repeat protein [Spirochaeta cellobiosiphila]
MKQVIIFLFISCVLTVSAFSQDGILFRQAEEHFQAGRIQLALNQYEQIIKKYPLSRYLKDSYYGEALATMRLGQDEEAKNLWLNYLNQYPEGMDDASFWLGASYFKLGQWQDALDYLSKTSNDSAYSEEADRLSSISLAKLNKNKEAAEVFQQFYQEQKSYSKYKDELVIYFSVLLKLQEYDKLIEIYEKLALQDTHVYHQLSLYASEAYDSKGDDTKSSAITRSLLGAEQDIAAVAYQRYFLIAQSNGDDMEAFVRQAERDLAGMPGILKEFWLRVGIDYYQKNNYDKAEIYLWRVWDLKDSQNISGTVPLYLSSIMEQKGDIPGAIQVIQSFTDISQDKRSNLLFKWGSLLIKQSQWEQSFMTMDTLIKEYPQFEFIGEARYLGSFALYKQKKYQKAYEYITPLATVALNDSLNEKYLRLKGQLEVKLNKDGITTYERYILVNPKDSIALIELANLYYQKGEYSKVLNLKDPNNTPQLAYLKGLCSLNNKDYDGVLRYLMPITRTLKGDNSNYSLKAYALFYAGWANYRLPNYPEAVRLFTQLYKEFPAHEFAEESRYMAGWCSFTMEDFPTAESVFRSLSNDRSISTERSLKSLQLLGITLVNEDKDNDALLVFEDYLNKDSKSTRAQEVAMSSARILTTLKGVDSGIAMYKKAQNINPSTSIGQEAAYSIAETYSQAGEYSKAKESFYQYRQDYPKGEYYDDALYWGGIAAQNIDEKFGALLLWEELLDIANSPYRSDALYRSAEIYASEGNYRKALNLYGELISSYPAAANSLQAETRSEQLRLQLLGLSDQEAELSVIIGKEGGSKSAKGREALVSLSRLYIYESRGKQGLAIKMLEDVISKYDEDPYWAARAQFLLGEYYARENDPLEAGKEYLKAATMNPSDRDLMAMSLYRAMDMSLQANKHKDAEALFQRLKSYFSDTPWVTKGQELLEAHK